jgi:preprotein translocase subunit SecE
MMDSPVVEAASPRKDGILLSIAALLAAAGLVAFYYFDPKLVTVVRLVILLAAFAAAAALFYRTNAGRDVWAAIAGARTELRKVVWPTRQESIQTTLMIAVVVLIMSLLMWGLDGALLFGVEKLTGRSS